MSVPSRITIELCSDDDMPDFCSTMSRGFEHDAPFVDMYFPNHDTKSGRDKGSERLLAWKKSGSGSAFLKAVLHSGDVKDGKMIGIAVWTLMRQAPPANLEEAERIENVWPDENDAEYMKRLWRKYVIPRTNAVDDSNGAGVYVLELLAVDKAYQHRGAGLALVKWGTNKADEEHLTAVVESTLTGRRTYEMADFQAQIERMDLDTGDEFSQKRKPELIFMTRGSR